MDTARWIGFALGLLILLLTGGSIIGTLVVPRQTGLRLGRLIFVLTMALFQLAARRFHRFEQRDRILAYHAPTGLMVLLLTWLGLLLLAFTLLFLPFVPAGPLGGALGDAFVLSGSSMFTLGFARSSDHIPVLTFAASVAGLAVVALEIGYLPVIYGAFNRRELLVTLLDSRAGSPAWGPEILARHELVDNVGNLRELYQRWELWAADVAETHTTYPPLIFFRSPDAHRSWAIGLLAVLDAASLHLATRPLTAPADARPCIRMGYLALRDISRVLHLPVNDDPHPDDPVTLEYEDFRAAVHHMQHAGWTLERPVEEAWIHYRGWRVTYESMAHRVADVVDAPPALWSGPRHRLPMALTPPTRPPHREPGPQAVELFEMTQRRRAARGEAASEPLVHDHDHDVDGGDYQA